MASNTAAFAITATGVQSALPIKNTAYNSVQVSGVFVGTVQLEYSNDGVNFLISGAAISAAAIQNLTINAQFVRVNCTAFTSGTINVVFSMNTGSVL